jgi:ABC-type nitrate/sulfonate/bicarbonate transport system substrate-binding protein
MSICGAAGLCMALISGSQTAAFADSGSEPISLATQSLTNVSLSIPDVGGTYLPFCLGFAKGFYRQYGIDLKIETLASSLATPEVESGGLTFSSANSEADAAAIHGQPVKSYAYFADRLDFVLVAPDSIKSVAQLRGHVIAGESATSAANKEEDQSLEASGVQPSQVKFVNISTTSGRVAIMESGKASATIMEYATFLELPAGYHTLFNASRFEAAGGGLATTTKYASSHPTVMRDMITATRKAVEYIKSNEAGTVSVIESRFTLDKASAQKDWKFDKGCDVLGILPPAGNCE